jgi:hypothetical protein
MCEEAFDEAIIPCEDGMVLHVTGGYGREEVCLGIGRPTKALVAIDSGSKPQIETTSNDSARPDTRPGGVIGGGTEAPPRPAGQSGVAVDHCPDCGKGSVADPCECHNEAPIIQRFYCGYYNSGATGMLFHSQGEYVCYSDHARIVVEQAELHGAALQVEIEANAGLKCRIAELCKLLDERDARIAELKQRLSIIEAEALEAQGQIVEARAEQQG